MVKPHIIGRVRQDSVSLDIELITPERALDLLCGNTNNRKIRPRELAKYARDMREGKWLPGIGDPVHIDPSTGEIGNGQHRLHAILEAEVAVELPVLYAPIAYRKVADTGMKRKFADVLTIEYGEDNVTAYAAAVRVLWEYTETGLMGSIKADPSTSELLDVYLSHPDLKLSVPFGKRVNSGVGARPGLVIALHYLFAQVDRHAANDFCDRLAEGAALGHQDPILAARKWFFGTTKTGNVRDQASMLIRAFNDYRTGRHITYYRRTDEFPKIRGL